jgi:hypothetical protein
MLLMVQEWIPSEFGDSFYICLPGNDIPDWFTYKEEGPSVSFEVPRMIEGFTLRIVYSLCLDKMVDGDLTNYFSPLDVTVINYTKNITHIELSESFNLSIAHEVEDHVWQVTIDKLLFDLEASDRVEVNVNTRPGVDVKKTGVFLIYDRVVDGSMVHYASTSNKDAIIVSDNGDASIDHVAIESKRGLSDDKSESGYGCFDDDREAKRLRCEHNPDGKAESSCGCFDDDREAKRLRCDHDTEMSIDDD